MTIKKAQALRNTGKAEFLRYFAELGTEYEARAQRMEARLLAGKTAKGSPDLMVDKPTWELDDVCCFTDASERELRNALGPLFEGYFRYRRALAALHSATRLKLPERRSVAASGLRSALESYLDLSTVDHQTESTISAWLEPMFGTCHWSQSDHFGAHCHKPVPWTKTDLTRGFSTRRHSESATVSAKVLNDVG